MDFFRRIFNAESSDVNERIAVFFDFFAVMAAVIVAVRITSDFKADPVMQSVKIQGLICHRMAAKIIGQIPDDDFFMSAVCFIRKIHFRAFHSSDNLFAGCFCHKITLLRINMAGNVFKGNFCRFFIFFKGFLRQFSHFSSELLHLFPVRKMLQLMKHPAERIVIFRFYFQSLFV